MHKITFISTVHKEIGKCNADELHKIIEQVNPEVIFLEALDGSYSKYEQINFSQFQVPHNKLEIAAIQKYSDKYIPVLDNKMSDAFEKKYSSLPENIELRKLLDDFNFLANEYGFQFLNSKESIMRQEEMRIIESSLLNDEKLNIKAREAIDGYEDSMLRNIYSYCKSNEFDRAVFMCGVAHRKSIIEKVKKRNTQEEISLNWVVFGN
ncbi:hypothetical protein [Sediminibacterium soli]|uniref:hypothetical protein n=1 Tax=Sediminibacterium soli TaxID=2698829 RepID=UPI00137A5F43|nr:hypothetical protein [Sediminibacterium soli]NCI45030.1 hypothetical protein [Sediminibacterium soli]